MGNDRYFYPRVATEPSKRNYALTQIVRRDKEPTPIPREYAR